MDGAEVMDALLCDWRRHFPEPKRFRVSTFLSDYELDVSSGRFVDVLNYMAEKCWIAVERRGGWMTVDWPPLWGSDMPTGPYVPLRAELWKRVGAQ
jgi:hypothetical protein